MARLDIKDSIEINVNADKAWEIIGPNFLNIGDWGRGISKSWHNEAVPKKFEDSPAGGRFCDLGKFGVADERIAHYDVNKREITWTADVDKIPGFLKNLQNALSVEEIDENSCRVKSNITADLSGIRGALLGGPIKGNFTKLLKGFVGDWKTYAETGQPSDYKKRELEKVARKI